MISRLQFSLSVACLILLLTPALLRAQEPDTFEDKVESGKQERKERQWFRRAHEASAAEQLAYADRLLESGKLSNAARAYNVLVHRWHESPEAVQAQLRYAKILYDRRKYAKAFNEFQYLVDYFAGHFPYKEVIGYQYEIARHVMTVRHGKLLVFRGFADPEQALPLFEKVIANAPNQPESVQAKLTIGVIHEEVGDLAEAVDAYEKVEQHHPDSPEARDAAFRKAVCLDQMSKKSPRDERSCREAISAFSSFKLRYSDDSRMGEVDSYIKSLSERLAAMYFSRAKFYDELAKKPESALIAYHDYVRKFPNGGDVDKAMDRIRAIESEIERGK